MTIDSELSDIYARRPTLQEGLLSDARRLVDEIRLDFGVTHLSPASLERVAQIAERISTRARERLAAPAP